MGLCEQVYFDPALVDIIDGAFYYWGEAKAKTLKLLPKWIIGSSAEQAADKGPEEKTAKRDLEGAVAEGGETVEPILDAFGAYSTCAMFTVYNVRLGVAGTRLFVEFGAVRTAVDGRCPAQVFVLLILIGFREEVQMTKLYNIKNNDMLYFLLFSVVLIPFQFIADVSDSEQKMNLNLIWWRRWRLHEAAPPRRRRCGRMRVDAPREKAATVP